MTMEKVRITVEKYLGMKSLEVTKVREGILLRFLPGNPLLLASEDAAGKLHLYSFPHSVSTPYLSGKLSAYLLASREEIAVL